MGFSLLSDGMKHRFVIPPIAVFLTTSVICTAGYSSLVEAVDLTKGISPGGKEFRLPTDISSGFDSDWERNLGSNKPWNITIVSKKTGAPVRAGSKAVRFEVRHGDCGSNVKTKDCGSWDGAGNGGRFRSEMTAYDEDIGRHGTKEWLAFSIYLPSNYKTLNSLGGKTHLGQWHYLTSAADQVTGNDQKYCCDFMFGDSTEHEVVGQPGNYKKIPGITDKGKRIEGHWIKNNRWKLTPNTCTGCGHNKQLLTMKQLRGHWNDILVHVNWRYDKKGFFKVYANNKLIYTYRGATTWKHHNQQGLHIGIYQNLFVKKVKSKTQIAYFDEIRRGRSRAVVTKNLTPLFTYPKGKEILRRGKRYALTWNKGNAGSKVKIELYRGAKRYRTVIATTRNDGRYTWKIPSSLVKATNYRLKLLSKKNKNNYDFSDGYFSIK